MCLLLVGLVIPATLHQVELYLELLVGMMPVLSKLSNDLGTYIATAILTPSGGDVANSLKRRVRYEKI